MDEMIYIYNLSVKENNIAWIDDILNTI